MILRWLTRKGAGFQGENTCRVLERGGNGQDVTKKGYLTRGESRPGGTLENNDQQGQGYSDLEQL